MNHREAREKERRERLHLGREHRALRDFCNDIGGTTEITEKTVDGKVVDGLTCRVQGGSLVSAYENNGETVVVQWDAGAEMQTVHENVDGLRRRSSRSLDIVRDGNVEGTIDYL